MPLDRDRDLAGRPRNARPRDGLGRPLPHGARGSVDRVPDELAIPLADAVELAQRYPDTDRPFHAHEVLEALWKSRPPTERDLWQGLAQIAVGITHALRGNPTGAMSLLERGSDRLRDYRGASHGIAVEAVLAQTGQLVESLRDGTDAWPQEPERFRVHLTAVRN